MDYVTAYREAIVDVCAKGVRLIYDAFEADHSGSERTQVSFKIVFAVKNERMKFGPTGTTVAKRDTQIEGTNTL